MSTSTNEQISNEEYSSSRHSTPNSSGGEKQFHFGSNNNLERGSGQNSRTSSVAESTTINIDGFSNYTEIIQHLQTVWNKHNHINENSRRSTNDETNPSHYSKGHSQQHYTHHQYSGHQNWTNYNNPRRSGGSGNYSRGYNSGNNDGYWNQKGNRFPSHRSVNSLMTNSTNYQQQSQPSPPTQRRQGDIQQQQYHHNEQQQSSQSYYKKNRSDHDRRPNGYNSQQQSFDSHHQPNNSVQNLPITSSEQPNISSTQSFPNNLNSFNR